MARITKTKPTAADRIISAIETATGEIVSAIEALAADVREISGRGRDSRTSGGNAVAAVCNQGSVSAREAARFIGCSERMIYRLMNDGKIGYTRRQDSQNTAGRIEAIP